MAQTSMDRSKAFLESKNYGGVSVLYVPYEMIWVPDIVLYNNADSNYNITISTKATLRYDGEVTWEPPAIFKSLCQIDVRWFPFDEQHCHFKFGSWTYSEDLLHLELLGGDPHYELEVNANGEIDNITIVEDGIDLSDYYPSVEWDIISRVAKEELKIMPVVYYLELRRKPLFYTVNLVFPCVGISFLTILVFYLPSHSGEKITLCISILVTLTVFYLLLTEIIPATSISLPLIGKYLLFTMVMVTLSVIVTVISLNLYFRKPTTHRMPEWVKWFFLKTLPKMLLMRRPLNDVNDLFCKNGKRNGELYKRITMNYHEHAVSKNSRSPIPIESDERIQRLYRSPHVVKAFENICFIAELLKKQDRDAKVDEDWKYVAMVLDRLFLLFFRLPASQEPLQFFFNFSLVSPITINDSGPSSPSRSPNSTQS
ncbi:hypothetical protein DINM_003305 [Dirofilaria immitis]|nr:hypothetical protein [Dirofilaria immitis]